MMMNIDTFKATVNTIDLAIPTTVTFERCFLAEMVITLVDDMIEIEATYKDKGNTFGYRIDLDTLADLLTAEKFGRAFNLLVKPHQI